MFKSIVTAGLLALAIVTPTLADTNAPTTTPSPEITTPAPVCYGGPTWEAGQETFLAQVTSAGGKLVGVKENDSGFFVVIDIRGMSDYDGDPAFLFVLQFDVKDHCFVTSGFFDPQVIQDVLGIVLAKD